MEFVCGGYIERTSVANVSASVIVLSESPFERNGKWETRPILKEDRLLWAFS
jgi:hypothetical protein